MSGNQAKALPGMTGKGSFSEKRRRLDVVDQNGDEKKTPEVDFCFKKKPCGFDPWSGHMPRLQVQSPFGACMGDSRSMFLSHIYVFLSLS